VSGQDATVTYDLWDVETRFYYGRYTSEDEALHLVATLLDHYGDRYADKLELIVGEDGAENLTGMALVERARRLVRTAGD
jgi:hypothetical protein